MQLRHKRCAIALAVAALGISSRVQAADITIDGIIKYTGPTGNAGDDTNNGSAPFAVRGAKVELWDDNVVTLGLPADVLLGTTYTDDTGHYTFTVDDADTIGPAGFTLDPYLNIYSQTAPNPPAPNGVPSGITMYAAGPLTPGGDDTLGPQYVFRTPTTNNIPAGQPFIINKTFDTSNDVNKSFAPFDAMTEASRYYSTLPGAVTNAVNTVFPTGENTSNFSNNQMHILQGDRYDWDVDMHEYGHYVQSLTPGISSNPGGAHSSLNNLRFSRGTGGQDTLGGSAVLTREGANKLAWAEGWATYFSISGQQVMNAAALGIQRVGDTVYDDNDDDNGTAIGLRYGIENRSVGNRPARGEDNEASVARILYDLYDSTNDAADRDRVTLGDKKIWNLIVDNKTDTLSKFWSALIGQGGITNTDRINYGAIFEAHNVSPEPDEFLDGEETGIFSDSPLTFDWDVPVGGQNMTFTTKLLHNFGLKFFNAADTEIFDSGLLGDVTTYTPDVVDWELITNNFGEIRWIVYGQESTAGAYTTGNYWSDSVSFDVVVPEPATIALIAPCLLMLGRRKRRH